FGRQKWPSRVGRGGTFWRMRLQRRTNPQQRVAPAAGHETQGGRQQRVAAAAGSRDNGGMAPTIDRNCDLGETVDGRPTADAEALFDLITSANVACGFHAGDVESMRVSCRRAADRGVSVGAHVSYDDRAGFGRRRVDIDPAVLTGQLIEQITALQDAAARAR